MPSVLPRLRFACLAVLVAALFSTPLVIASSGTANVGQSVTFSVTVNGTAPFTYQWYKDSAVLTGGTSATYTISSVGSADAGTYYVVVANSAGSTTSDNAVLTVSGAVVVAPSITTQPSTATVNAGLSASFSVVASGTAPLAYQWRKDGSNISGATSATYTISSTQAADAASYSAVVTNSAGSATSNSATLTVNVAPSITTQPSSLTVTAGQSASFSVVAGGTAPLTYQWRKGGSNIGGATSATYSIASTQASDAATYSVVVTNTVSSITSNGAVLAVNAAAVAPSITSQPASATVNAGQSASFSVVASGTAPLTCQWRKGGTNIGGATSATYTISSTQASDAASYSVVVTNSVGSATSNNATLTVNVAPSITSQPASATVNAGQSASFSVVASGTAPLTCQWRKGGTNIGGATSATYTISSTQASDAASYSVVVTNSAGSATSSNATLTVNVAPSITSQPSSVSVTTGQSASFSVVASGTASLTYQWRKDGTSISGATSATYTISNPQASDAATYSVVVTNSVGSATSNNATLTVTAAVVAPAITTQPSPVTVAASQSASFSVVASGTAPLTYQWRKDGTNIGGAASATYTISSAQSADAGSYSVVVTNSAGTATSNAAALTVTVAVAPSITSQPSSLTVTAGQSASFSAVASGTAPLTYQWRKDGANLSGATNATYSIGSVQAADAGNYSVVASNSAGSATSNNAVLTVNVPPAITTQPSALSVTAGQSASFSVVASGTAPLSYQWRKGGVNIIGATSATYTIGTAQTTDATAYSVVVTNSAGSATSNDATLTVTAAAVAPTITTQPSSVSVTTGNSASFTVAASGTAPLSCQWRKGGVNISGANSSTYSISSAQSSDAGDYSVVVSNSAGSATSGNATLTVVGEAPRPPSNQTKLINLSSRTQVGTGSNITISGFVVGGTQPKTLLIRGIGPALADYGVGGVMTTPTMTVFAGQTVVATNEGWKSSDTDRIRAEAQRLGAFALPENGRDCAIIADFAPGIYTVHLKGKNEGTGVGLIELYDANAGSDSKLINLSVRAFVGQNENMLITGLVVSGSAPKTILVRAVGPGLAAYGVDGVLARPRMALLSGQQEIASNTGWTTSANRDAIAGVAAQVGAFPLDPNNADSAMLLTLDPGIYTIQVKGANGETGTALVESYVVD